MILWLVAALTAVGLLPVAAAHAAPTEEKAATQTETTTETRTTVNLALKKPIEASSSTQHYFAPNANDGSVNTYWEASAHPSTLTVKLGADANLTSVVLKLNPDPAWSTRTQTIEVLGRAQSADGFSTVEASADYTFSPASNHNTVTIPVSGRYADVRLKISANSSGYAGQVAEFEVNGEPAPNPDLTVTDLSWQPAQPSESDAIKVAATVRNTGSAASAATTVDVSLGGTVAGSAKVGALGADESATASVDIGKRAQGSYTVSAVVDPDDTVAEQNNDNNSRTAGTKLTVGRARDPTSRSPASRPTRPTRQSAPTSPSR